MGLLKDVFGGKGRVGGKPPADSRNSLDTTSSMNTAETGDGGDASSIDLLNCPFMGHPEYEPVRELHRQPLGGQVYLARHQASGQHVVVKLIERGPSVTRHVETELLIHRQCTGHPNIIQLLDVFLTPRFLAIVLEWAPGGDLLDYVNAKGGLGEDEARWFFQQLAMGLAYLHSIGVDSRELKLDNKLLTGDERRPILKIVDFTYSKSEQINSDPSSALGSLPYTAPEVLSNNMRHGTHADLWSLGVALYKLVVGRYPFERPEDAGDPRTAVQAVLGRIARVDYVIPDNLSPPLRDLLCRMLVKSPEGRIGLEEVTRHPWFTASPALPGLLTLGQRVNPGAAKQSEAEIVAVVREAQVPLRPIDSDNIDDLADDILAEEEADDLLEELTLSGI